MIVNDGLIRGGDGGKGGQGGLIAAGVPAGAAGASGAGAAAIIGSSLSVTNAGSLVGGLAADGVTRSNAVTFTGGTNRFTIQAGSSVTGNVVAFSTADVLAFELIGTA
jgi:hypothetical protein